jgi:hypothetical protein
VFDGRHAERGLPGRAMSGCGWNALPGWLWRSASMAPTAGDDWCYRRKRSAAQESRRMMLFDNEVATIAGLHLTGRICLDAAGVRRQVIGRELRARGDRERPGQDLPPGDMIFGGAATGHPPGLPA